MVSCRCCGYSSLRCAESGACLNRLSELISCRNRWRGKGSRVWRWNPNNLLITKLKTRAISGQLRWGRSLAWSRIPPRGLEFNARVLADTVEIAGSNPADPIWAQEEVVLPRLTLASSASGGGLESRPDVPDARQGGCCRPNPTFFLRRSNLAHDDAIDASGRYSHPSDPGRSPPETRIWSEFGPSDGLKRAPPTKY